MTKSGLEASRSLSARCTPMMEPVEPMPAFTYFDRGLREGIEPPFFHDPGVTFPAVSVGYVGTIGDGAAQEPDGDFFTPAGFFPSRFSTGPDCLRYRRTFEHLVGDAQGFLRVHRQRFPFCNGGGGFAAGETVCWKGEGLLLADGLPGEFGLLLGLALEFVSEFVLGSLLSEVTDSDAPGSRGGDVGSPCFLG